MSVGLGWRDLLSIVDSANWIVKQIGTLLDETGGGRDIV